MQMQYVRKKVSFVGAALVLFSVLLLPAAANAQSTTAPGPGGTTTRPPLSLTTSPIPLSVVTKPGKTVTADIRVKNNSTQTEVLKIELLKFGANGESGTPQLLEREAKDTYFEWVSFSEKSFTAEPGVWKTVKMTIKTPNEAAFGYYLAVLFSRASPDKPAGGASAFDGGIASLVLLDVETPGAKREAKVANFTATRKVYEFLPADLNVRLSNEGNVHVAPTGTIFIKRGNAQVAALDFNTQRGNILPGSKRLFETSWTDGFPVYVDKIEGNKTTRNLKWDFGKLQNLRIGKYTATLVAVYDNGRRDIPVEATVSFWVIPWRILGVTLVIGLLAFGGIIAALRGVWKKIRRTPAGHDNDDHQTPTGGVGATAASTADPVAQSPSQPAAQPVVNPVPASEQATQTEPTESDQKISKPEATAVADVPKSAPVAPAGPVSDTKPKTAPELKD